MKDFKKEFSKEYYEHLNFLTRNISAIYAPFNGGLSLQNTTFNGYSFLWVDLSKAHLQNNTFINCTFHECALSDTLFNGSTFSNVKFSRCNLSSTYFYHTNLTDAIFYRCNGNGREIKSIQIHDLYDLAYTKQTLFIGCKEFKITDFLKGLDHVNLTDLSRDEIDLLKFHYDCLKHIVTYFPAV